MATENDGLSQFDLVRRKMLTMTGRSRVDIKNTTMSCLRVTKGQCVELQEPVTEMDVEEDADLSTQEETNDTQAKNLSENQPPLSFSTSLDASNTLGPPEMCCHRPSVNYPTSLDAPNTNGPYALNFQASLEVLVARMNALEEENKDLREKINNNRRAIGENHEESRRKSDELKRNIVHVQEDVQILQSNIESLENENKLLKSMTLPRSVDDWLGMDTDKFSNTVFTDALVTYFSKVLNQNMLTIIGTYFDFTDADVYGITHSAINPRECCRLFLKTWCNKLGDKATIGKFLKRMFRISKSEASAFDCNELKQVLQKKVSVNATI